MIKVTSTKTIDFPGLKWGITKGDERELPKDKEAQKIILEHPLISEVKGTTGNTNDAKDEGGDK